MLALGEKSKEIDNFLACNPSPELDLVELVKKHPKIANLLLNEPEKTLSILKSKSNLTFTITNLPFASPLIHHFTIPPSKTQGRLVSFSGIVVRVSSAKVAQKVADFQCSSCGSNVKSFYNDSDLGGISKPLICSHTNNKGTVCGSNKFLEVPKNSSNFSKDECFDYQEIKVQEMVNKLEIGVIPKSIVVILKDALVESVRPGDSIVLIGYLVYRWKPLALGKSCFIQTAFNALKIIQTGESKRSIANSDELKAKYKAFWQAYPGEENRILGREIIVKSFCRQIYGLWPVKLALILALIGGNSKTNPEEAFKVRSDSHVLLAGDSGTAKSQLLKFTHSIGLRAILTCGIGSTSAGLTASAIRESSEWVLEAGALVLADNGVCCIDEFSCISDADKTTIHEAMEQQSISIAKAGIVCRLNTRCPIIAACNLSKSFASSNETSDLSEALGISSPLLSRFDLVFVLLDGMNEELDEKIASFLLKQAVEEETASLDEKSWSLSELQSYIAFVKYNCTPQMTEECMQIIQEYFCLQRQSDYTGMARSTVRMLESLVRLCEAHAKLLFKETADEYDAIWAIRLVEESLLHQPILGFRKGLFHSYESLDEIIQEQQMMREIAFSRLFSSR